jgi:hypothetical protein
MRFALLATRAAFVAACALSAACEKQDPKPATQVLVTVDSDLVVGTELTSVQIEIRTTEGVRETPRHTFELATDATQAEQVELPFSFGVAKAGQPEFQLRVTGLKDDQTVVDLRWNVGFQDQKTLGLSVFLGAVCAGNLCTSGETCYPRRKGDIAAGSCAKVPDASTSPVTPGDEFRDAGVIEVPEAVSGDAAGAGGAAGSAGAGRGGAGGAGVGGAGRGGAGSAAGAGSGAGAGGASGSAAGAGAACSTTVADYYPDLDGDGHGDPSLKRSVCGTPPVGFVSAGDDCCDSDNRAFPGQKKGDASSSTCADVGFDFDCDGTEELGWPFLASGTCCLNTEQEGWEGAVPDCGETAQFTQCDDLCEPVSSAAKQRCF